MVSFCCSKTSLTPITEFTKLIFIVLIFYLITPIILLLFLVNCVLRLTLQLAKPLLNKHLDIFVSSLSALFAVDDLYFRDPTGTLVLGCIFEGTLTKTFVCQLIMEKWLDKIDLNGKLVYPELRQGIHHWFGYSWWKNDEHFVISNYVKVVTVNSDKIPLTKRDLVEIFVGLVNRPFVLGRSPWEVVIINGYYDVEKINKCENEVEDESTLVLLKIHHSLMDGISIRNLGMDLMNDSDFLSDFSTPDQKYVENSIPTWHHVIRASLRIPYFIAKSLYQPTPTWISGSKKVAFFNYSKLSMVYLKEIKSRHKVSLTSVLLAGYVAGIRHALWGNGELGASDNYSCVVPVPLTEHPKKLRNHMSFVSVKLPLLEPCSLKRLLILHENLENARNSLDPLSLFYLLKCISIFPSIFVKMFLRQNPANFLLSNFPGLPVPLNIGNFRCKQMFFNGGMLQGNIHSICSIVGYHDSIGLAVTTDELFVKGSKVSSQEFMEFMLNEFEILKTLNEN